MAPPIDDTVDASLRAYVDAAARALDLPIGTLHHAGVLQQFARIAALARLVADHRFDITDESAPLTDPDKRS